MGAGRPGGVRAATTGSIELDFYYRGVRCRERLKLAPNSRNLRYAESRLGQIRIEIEKGTFDYHQHFPTSRRARLFAKVPKSLDTIAEHMQRWLDRKELELEHSTMAGYRRIVDNILIPKCGKVLLKDFDRVQAKLLVEQFGEETSAKRIHNCLGPLRGMLDEAVEDGMLTSNPLKGLKIRRRAKADARDDIDPFTPEEMQAIIANCEHPQIANYCKFNFATGLRTSEMIGLRWEDIDWRNRIVRIRRAWVMGQMKAPKTDSGVREVELLTPAIEALKAQRAHTQLAGGFIFHDPRTDERWGSDQSIRAGAWQRALRRAEVRYRYPYQMRHTFASQALTAGENVMWVSRQMGHSDWTITAKKYARWIPSIIPDAGAKLAALWVTDVVQDSPETGSVQ